MTRRSKDYEVTEGNIFADLELDQPEELLAKAKLMHRVATLIRNSKLSQKEVAKRLGITQPMVSLLLSGRLSAFRIETLLEYLPALGCEVQIKVNEPSSRYDIFNRKGHIWVMPPSKDEEELAIYVEEEKRMKVPAYRKVISKKKRRRKPS